MKNLHCICEKYKKIEKPKISCFLEKILALSIICNNCKNVNEILFREEESFEILKILSLNENI